MIKGWIIHKETAFAPRIVFLEHTHSTAQHWSLPLPVALAHLPNGLRAGPSQNVSNSCPSKDFQEETKEYVARNPFLCNRVSKVFCYKVGCSSCVFKACLRTAPRTHGSCQNSSLKNCSIFKTFRRLSPKKCAGVTANYAGITGNYPGVTGNYAGVTTRHFKATLCKTLRF